MQNSVEDSAVLAATAKPAKANRFQLRLGERRAVLLLGDFAAALLSLALALYFWGSSDRFFGFSIRFLEARVPPWFYLLPLAWLILLIELHDIHSAADWGKTVRGIGAAALFGFGLYLLLYFSYVESPRSLLPRRGVAGFLVSVSLLTLAWRRLYIQVFTAPQFLRRVLLVGGGHSGQILINIYRQLKQPPFTLVGVVDDDPEKQDLSIEDIPVIGTSEDLIRKIQENGISDVIVAISGEMKGTMFQALLDVQQMGVEIIRMPVAYEELLGRVPIRLLEADWILRSFVDQARGSAFFELAKRLMDLAGGLAAMAFLIVLAPFISMAILLDDGFPILYRQTRLGRNGCPYSILKFRTMRRDAEADGKPRWAKEDDERATRVGGFLRKTHLDELPQFLNVLRGEMSLVGPRAERPELVALFQKQVPFYRARLLVKPGITGWAQVNFGYASTIEETIIKLEYDLYYIKHRSLILDILIILRTPATVFGLRGR